ncbi:MAG TPA: carbohydrate-binding protein [Vicinamibacterales bacterium]|nr:carbohydrate-binding protein [Vicinamibacterales bacterium]
MKKCVLLVTAITLGISSGVFAQSTPYSGTPAAVPGTIQAEDFDNGGEGVAYYDTTAGNSGGAYRQTDVDIEASSEGGYDVGWIAAGEWLNYSVNVAAAGSYTVQVRIAAPTGATMHVGFNGPSNVWQSLSLPGTGGWQNWTTVSFTATLGAGRQLMTLYADTAGYNVDYIVISSGATATVGSLTPYHGTPAVVPGTIQAEDFDNGGQGVAYYDSTPGNSGGAYRQTDVDIEPASGGGYDVGWITPGEWLNYTLSVPAAGSYTIQLRVASPNGGSMHVGFNGPSNVWQTVAIPNTGGWQTWTSVSFTATLGAGTQQMTLLSDTGGYNVDSVTISALSSAPPASPLPASPPPPATGSGTTLPVVEWNIQINDGSEAHARLAMDMLLSNGPRPEVVVIVEAWQSNYGFYIDELQKQTGLTWYGAFATHCAPGDWNGSTCSPGWYQGIGIFSTHPITDTSSMFFPYPDCWTSARVGLRAQINLNGLPVQIFLTHLQTGGCENDAQSRYNSMRDLKAWASQYAAPQLVAGDFNADADQIDTTQGMLPNFVDSWPLAGSGPYFTALLPNPTMKLDYWFSDASMRATPITSVVNTSTGSVSDHYPLEATFLVK